ncbi:OmpP1/FadL family transporter [Afifella marina]|uniref:Long-chain fatty acid transport protein n=1 Tax=Afifella marina DSM 2698 TaxID=1120955 RepID=A0A1G5N7I0_AFIMA|nr:OmpP1/FadL family transporter [Afifella marina]SCZ32731.1 long-chain fatty acid transport protein [Afifella marina DSM 2698]
MHKLKRHLGHSVAAAALIAVTTSSMAHAGAFALREQSAYGQGMAFAGMAAGGSLSSMFWNPATLSAVMGFQSESVISYIAPRSDVDVLSPFPQNEGDIAENAPVPASYYGYRVNDKIILGLGINAPFGLATKYDYNSLVRTSGIAGTTEVFTMAANPVVAYQFNDYLTVAVGAVVEYANVRLTGQALPVFGVSALDDADDVGFGITAGIQLKPMDGTEIGIGYRSRIDHDIEGPLVTQIGTFDVEADGFDLPDKVSVGLRQRIMDGFRLTAGIEWANWSRFETVTLSGAPAAIPLGFEYEDSWYFALGGEYDVNPDLTVRAGVARELSPNDNANRSFRLPDNDRWWFSAGASYQATERFSFDVGYSYITADDTDLVPAAAGGPLSNGPFDGTSDGSVHILSAALKMKFGGPRTEEPIVAKY